jgi:hypothetical protein
MGKCSGLFGLFVRDEGKSFIIPAPVGQVLKVTPLQAATVEQL